MNDGIPMAPLGEVLAKSENWITLDPEVSYQEVTVRLWGKGVVQRRVASGAEIAGVRRMAVRAGQFILSRIDARNGAFGLVPESLNGAVVSNDFPVFTPNPSRILPAFLDWLSKTPGFVDLCRAASEGTTNRVRLKEDRFLSMTMPLPPLAEQRRIVARIEALAAKIEAARGLRRQAAAECESLLHAEAQRTFRTLAEHHSLIEFGSFRPHVTSGPRNWGAQYAEAGLRFYRAQDIGPHGQLLDSSKVFIVPPETSQGRSAKLSPGDLMIVITGATVGRCTVFSCTTEPGFVSQHVSICRLPESQVNPYFALWGLRSPMGQDQLLGQRYGQGKPGLNLANIRALKLPLPPTADQRRIVAYLDGLQAKVDAVKRLQAETAAELAALLPAVLDRAFKGEL